MKRGCPTRIDIWHHVFSMDTSCAALNHTIRKNKDVQARYIGNLPNGSSTGELLSLSLFKAFRGVP
jgi:hypothetical protein